MNLKITGITLLSTEETENIPENLKSVGIPWWLRSPGVSNYYASIVGNDGCIYSYGNSVCFSGFGIRPALIFNPESSNLKIGDKFKLAEYDWTIITENIALCNGIIDNGPFREDWQAEDANNYEKSDIKKFLENWAEENHIIDKPDTINDK